MSQDLPQDRDQQATATATDVRPRIVLPKALPIPKPLSDSAVRPGFVALRALTAGLDIERTDGEAALDRIMPLLEALEDDDVPPRVNVSVRNTAIAALGVLGRILAIRPDAVRYAPNHSLIYLDSLEDILLSLLQTDTVLQMTAEDKKEVAAMAEPLFSKRDEYSGLAHGFAKFRIIDAAKLEVIGKEGGYKALARDLEILVTVFRQAWPKIGNGLPFTQQDLAQLSRDATALNLAIGIKEQNPNLPKEANVLRRRVLALFRLAEDDIRRLVSGLYGYDAVESIIPSFSNSPKGTRSKGTQGAEAEAATNADATEPASDAPGTSASTSSAQRPSGFVINNPENLPITPPFIEDADDDKKRTA